MGFWSLIPLCNDGKGELFFEIQCSNHCYGGLVIVPKGAGKIFVSRVSANVILETI